MRKWISAVTAAALAVATAGPALSQSHGFAQQFNDEAGATVSLNYRMPLGGGRAQAEEPSYGVTLHYGYRDVPNQLDTGDFRPNLEVADLRFNGSDLNRAEVANINFMRNSEGEFDDPRLNAMADGKDATTWIIISLVIASVAVCLLAGCFDDDDEDHHSTSPST